MDASSPTAIAKLLLPKVPLILRTTVAHSLWLSDTSSKWDLRTEVIVKLIRSLMDPSDPSTVSKAQSLSLRDSGIKGRMWISKVTLPKPEEDSVLESLSHSFNGLKEGGEILIDPEVRAVEAEWTGYRRGVDKNAPELDITESEKYTKLMEEVTNGTTIFLMDPASHRPVTSQLAKLTGGRVFSVRYRLAPQQPFPAALVDALISYLSLLYPPPNSVHAPVPASQIVFAGDSAGGGLSLCLLQFILSLHHQSQPDSPPTMLFHGHRVPVPIPAGVACSSAWANISCSLPSYQENAKYDFLPPATSGSASKYPPCEIWPPKTGRKRQTLYADDSCLIHPLVSPVTAPSWAGAPPILLLTGEEMLSDENDFIARRIAATEPAEPGEAANVIIYQQYKTMPHAFAQVLPWTSGSKKCYASWASFMRDCCDEDGAARARLKSRASVVEPKTLQETEVEFSELARGLDMASVKEMIRAAIRRRGEGIEGEAKAMPKL
ncbi:MAG: hypothetical protein M1837_006580 [Sclerophora amabilis]|nr:MAG: hypothetical protein M1837_006580 [Sclerophora amabilis]